jgi:hypothetical protein
MTSSPELKEPVKFLGGIASILSLLGICLFFSGWIYRWAYYSFFQLEITRLELSSQSFLLVPLQIFLGSPVNILKSALILALIPILVNLTLWLVRLLQNLINQILNRIPQLKAFWQRISDTNQARFASTSFFQSLLKELVIVTWVLLLIFWFARYQGESDARRDVVNETSTLPIVTLITDSKNLILGTNLAILNDEIPNDPNITNNVMIGDINLAKIIRSYGINDLKEQRVWRLLTERGGWIFLFPTLSQKSDANDRPLILAIPRASSEQIMILSPTIPKE